MTEGSCPARERSCATPGLGVLSAAAPGTWLFVGAAVATRVVAGAVPARVFGVVALLGIVVAVGAPLTRVVFGRAGFVVFEPFEPVVCWEVTADAAGLIGIVGVSAGVEVVVAIVAGDTVLVPVASSVGAAGLVAMVLVAVVGAAITVVDPAETVAEASSAGRLT